MSENEALIREIASVLDHPSLYMGGPSRGSMLKAKAILPIIRRRELEAGEKVKEAAAARLVSWDPPNSAWWCALSDGANSIRALDVAAIIGDSHD